MSKELEKIEENIMNQIHQGKVTMKPKMYFILGSFLTFIGVISTVVVSAFMIGLTKFYLRSNLGRGAQYKFDQLLTEFPWWIIIVAILGLVLGTWLVRKYDFSYKIKPINFIIGFILSIILVGFIIDTIGVNDMLTRKGSMRNFMKEHIQKDNIYKNRIIELR